jgi:hypothetical protein
MKLIMDCVESYLSRSKEITRGFRKPEIWNLYQRITETHKSYQPKMRFRSSLDSMEYTEYLYALFSYSAYRYSSNVPIKRINEFTLEEGLSDRYGVVFTNKNFLGVVTKIIVAFRGTDIYSMDDLVTDALILFGKETTAERFLYATSKIEKLREKYPEIPIVACGHSLGGSLAIYVSRKFNIPSYTYNPAQGLCPLYVSQVDYYPKIRVFRINTDLVSSLSGLDNVSGVVLFPPKNPDIGLLKNHSIVNFLPDMEIHEECDF